MEYSLATSSFMKFVLTVSCYCVAVFGLEERCEFPAIFNFGDSNSDTGGLAAAFPSLLPKPYGQTYFHHPAGRFSDGRLIIDFIGAYLNLPSSYIYICSVNLPVH